MAYHTYARTVLSDQRTLVELIQKYSDPKAAIVRELEKDINQVNVITSDSLNDALNHPHAGFLHFTIQTFGEYLRSVRKIYYYKDLIAEEKKYIENSVRQFHDDLDEMDGEEFEQLSNVVSKLEEHYVELLNEDEELDKNLDKLSGAVAEITKVINSQDEEWDNYRDEFNNKLVTIFTKLDFPLSDIEKDELLSQDSWQSMLNRVKELKIKLPSSIDVRNPNYGTYFQLKSYLAMYASLSRRMLPNSVEEIEKL